MVFISFFIGFCCGIIFMAVISDRINRREVSKLEARIKTDSENYLCAVNFLESEIKRLEAMNAQVDNMIELQEG